MAHRNARLTPLTRRELVEQVAAGWPQAEVARQFRVSRATVAKWVRRWKAEGPAGLTDRSSAPHHHPRQTPLPLAHRICSLRRQRGFGPHRIAWALGVARSTIYAVLRRAGLNRLSLLHRITREPVRRYEHPRPGDLLHIDVKKLGRIPPGGGKRFAPGFAATQGGPHSGARAGIDYLHVAVDDHSRYAYVEALPDERGVSCAAFLERAVEHLAQRGVTVRRALTDNAKAYTSAVFAAAATERGIMLKLTKPYRPQTNGKAERFIRTLQAEWAYVRRYHSNDERLRALDTWLADYNYTRPHGGIDGSFPASRL
jgi:transposase InsO family protein